MADPTGTMKISFAVSATPKVALDKSEGFYQAQTVIHEDVRTSVGGSGEVTSDDLSVTNWADGVNTVIDSATSPVSLGVSATTDIVIIKHTGILAATSLASATADTVKVQTTSGSYVIAELVNNEAIVLPRPATDLSIVTGNSSNHIEVQVTLLGS